MAMAQKATQMTAQTDLFIPVKFHTSVQLKPNELGPNIQDVIYAKLRNNLENMCSKHGFIRKGSTKIIKRSAGQIKVSHFNGNIAYDLYCVAEICNPAQGSIIKCRVKAKNNLGLLANGFYDGVPILEVIVPKNSAGIQSEINIDTINIGDEINVEVIGKKIQLYDKYISIIGRAIKDRTLQVINNVQYDEEAIDDAQDKETDDALPSFDDKIIDVADVPDADAEEDDYEDEEEDDGIDEEEDEEDDDEDKEELEQDEEDFGDFDEIEPATEFEGADEDYE
jgi:DNA-directed RNA polymerase subunit E'/Rpb7